MAPPLSQYSQCTDTIYSIDAFPQEPTTTPSNPFVNYRLMPSSSSCQTWQDPVNLLSCGLHSPTDSVIGDPSIQTIKAGSPNFAWNGSHLPSPASQTDGSFYHSGYAFWASPLQSSPIREPMPRPIPKRSATFPGTKLAKHPVASSESYQEDALGWNAGSTPDLSYLAADYAALQFSQAANSPESGLAPQSRISRWMIPDATFALEQSAMDGSSIMPQISSATQLDGEHSSYGCVTSFSSPPRAPISRQQTNPYRIQKHLPQPHYKNPLHAVKREMKLSQTRQQTTKTTHDRLESAYSMMKEAEEKGISNAPNSEVMQGLENLCPRLSYTEFFILGRFAEWYRGTFGQKWSLGQHIYTLALTGGGSEFLDHYDEKVLQRFVSFQVKANRPWCNDLRADPGTLCWKCVKYFGRFRKSPCDNEWHGS